MVNGRFLAQRRLAVKSREGIGIGWQGKSRIGDVDYGQDLAVNGVGVRHRPRIVTFCCRVHVRYFALPPFPVASCC